MTCHLAGRQIDHPKANVNARHSNLFRDTNMIWCESITDILKGITKRNVKQHYIDKLTKCFMSSNPKIACSNTFSHATIAEKKSQSLLTSLVKLS